MWGSLAERGVRYVGKSSGEREREGVGYVGKSSRDLGKSSRERGEVCGEV